jgi:hypothetical protein
LSVVGWKEWRVESLDVLCVENYNGKNFKLNNPAGVGRAPTLFYGLKSGESGRGLELGILNLEFGAWNLVLGIWCLEFGIWNFCSLLSSLFSLFLFLVSCLFFSKLVRIS